ncbi:A disintegrin and metalloproteinase with thrombospondin motifs adt-1-like [Watersipora subatra]|uniref:A disintegrin and metalloproteinase with thrombospondin motifs adt-1-like n=1 Tax=Watersipora subatra TaxID=2589382 RepID=UPI00355C092D
MAKFFADASVAGIRLRVSWRLYVGYVIWSACSYLVTAANPKCEDLPGCLTIQGSGTCEGVWENVCVTFTGCENFGSSAVMCGGGIVQATTEGQQICLPGVTPGTELSVGIDALKNTAGPPDLSIEISGVSINCERENVVCEDNRGFLLTFVAPPCPCACSEWSSWGACPTECGVIGVQQRTRNCPDTCDTESEENTCVVIPCPPCDCSEWSNWGLCPTECGVAGNRHRIRICIDACDVATELETCDVIPCPTCDCTEWSNWGACPTECGVAGNRQRTRICIDACDVATELETCDVIPCPTCDCTEWSNWGACPTECGVAGNRQRTRSCTDACDVATELETCDVISCPTCDCTEWSNWGACPTECGVAGNRQRTRSCTDACDVATELETCDVISCPTCDCTSWTPWRSCPGTCGVVSSRRRNRFCPNNCAAQLERRSCPSRSCGQTDTTQLVWNGWSTWTPCPVSCGGARRNRTRTCNNIEDMFDCPGSTTESQICGEESCPICDCTIWSTWTTCSISCGTSQSRQRSRSCLNCFFPIPPVTDTSSCPGIPTVCPTGGVWTEWLQWTPCSVTCGGSIQTRTRICTTPDQDCPGSTQESRACGEGACSGAQAFSRQQRGRSGGQRGGRQRQGQSRQRQGQGRQRQGQGRQRQRQGRQRQGQGRQRQGQGRQTRTQGRQTRTRGRQTRDQGTLGRSRRRW